MDLGLDCCYNSSSTIGDEHFCTTVNPCREDEGDCDANNECQGDLTCDNGCPTYLGFNANVSCCIYPNANFCEYPDHIGDGYCDDGNNKAECEWDNGDCCGSTVNCCSTVNTDYCSACECLNPNADENLCTSSHASYIGDNACDDENNNVECQWDGGDCCNVNENLINYCTLCECLDPNHITDNNSTSTSNPTTTTPSPSSTSNSTTTSGPATCVYPELKSNGYCNDESNTDVCAYDGDGMGNSDCCGDNVNTDHCSACECLDPIWILFNSFFKKGRNDYENLISLK